MKHMLIFLVVFLCGCGDLPQQSRAGTKNETGPSPLPSYQFCTPNNPSYSVDEIEIDGRRYLVLHDCRKAQCIIPKPNPAKTEKE